MDVAEEQMIRDIAALRAEAAELKAEYQHATGAAKASLQAKVAAANAKPGAAVQR